MSAVLAVAIAVMLAGVAIWISPHVRDYVRACRIPESEEVTPCRRNPSTSTPT